MTVNSSQPISEYNVSGIIYLCSLLLGLINSLVVPRILYNLINNDKLSYKALPIINEVTNFVFSLIFVIFLIIFIQGNKKVISLEKSSSANKLQNTNVFFLIAILVLAVRYIVVALVWIIPMFNVSLTVMAIVFILLNNLSGLFFGIGLLVFYDVLQNMKRESSPRLITLPALLLGIIAIIGSVIGIIRDFMASTNAIDTGVIYQSLLFQILSIISLIIVTIVRLSFCIALINNSKRFSKTKLDYATYERGERVVTNVQYCINCGSALEQGTTYCTKCGAKQVEE